MKIIKRIAGAVAGLAGYELVKGRALLKQDPFETQRRLATKTGGELTIFDIGANRGQTAQRYRAKFPNAEIYCFEPFPESVAVLQQHFAGDPKIHIVPKAVADSTGRVTFYVNAQADTNSLLPRPKTERRYFPKTAGPKTSIEVETVSLDDFVRDNNLAGIDILKFDIQGGELNALRGATELLGSGQVSLIYTEIMFIAHYVDAPLYHELASYLADFDYSLFDVYGLQRATNGQLRYGDAIFVSETVRENVIDASPEEP